VVELRLEVAATLAVAIADQQLRRQQALAALHALGRADRPDGIETLLARGYTGNGYEEDVTESAIGGQEGRKNALDCGNNCRDEEPTLLGALYSSLSI
jgi:hypothetical protein